MARRPAVTQDQVAEAAEALRQEGHGPTVRALLERIGGSATTITPMLDAWRQAQRQRETLAEVPVPPEVADVLAQAGAHAWSIAQTRARASLEGLQRKMDDAQAHAERDQAELLEIMKSVEAERDQAQLELDQVRQDIEAVRSEAASAAGEAARVLKALEIEHAGSLAQVAALRGQIDSIEARADREAEARRQAENDVVRLTERLAATERRVGLEPVR